MNRENFLNLSADERIEFFMSEYKKGNLHSEIVKKYGLAKNTVRGTFIRNNYEFNKEIGQFVLQKYDESITSECADTAECSESITEVIQSPKDEVLQKYHENDTLKTEMISGLNWIKEQQGKQEEYEEIFNFVRKQMKNENIIEIPILEINSEAVTGAADVKSIRTYLDILSKFNKFCESKKSFKKQDLLAQALYEFIEKYK